MRVALYSRVSSEDQVQKYGLPSQLSALRHLAATNGYEVVAEVADEGISGTVEARPGLERLRHLLLQHTINGVLIYDLSRLARDTLLCLRLLKELQEDLGAHVEFVNMKLDDTPESALFTGMSSLMFQFERQKLMQRTAGGRRAKAERGLVPGAPFPFGYEGDTTIPGGLRVIEAEAEVVRMLYSWAADGVSLREMVRRLAGRGVRARRGGIFHKASVAKIIRNSTYRGEYISHRVKGNPKAKGGRTTRPESEWIRIPVRPVVSQATWEKAQTTFAKNLTVGRGRSRVYLLKRLLFCGVCGRRYVGDRSHGRPSYRCSGRDTLLGDRRCRTRALSADTIEADIQRTIKTVLDDPEILFSAAERHDRKLAGRQVDVRREHDLVKKELGAVKQRRANLLDMAVDGTIPKAVFVDRDAPMQAEEERLRRRVEALTAEATSSAAAASQQRAVVAHARLLRRGLDKLDPAAWRAFLTKLVDKIVVQQTGLELHLVLSGAQVAAGSQRSNQSSSSASTLARAEIGSFSSSW